MDLHASTVLTHQCSSPFSSAAFESSLLFWQFLHPCCLELASVWLCIAHFPLILSLSLQVSFLVSATVFSSSLSLTASLVLLLTSFAAADSCLHLWEDLGDSGGMSGM